MELLHRSSRPTQLDSHTRLLLEALQTLDFTPTTKNTLELQKIEQIILGLAWEKSKNDTQRDQLVRKMKSVAAATEVVYSPSDLAERLERYRVYRKAYCQTILRFQNIFIAGQHFKIASGDKSKHIVYARPHKIGTLMHELDHLVDSEVGEHDQVEADRLGQLLMQRMEITYAFVSVNFPLQFCSEWFLERIESYQYLITAHVWLSIIELSSNMMVVSALALLIAMVRYFINPAEISARRTGKRYRKLLKKFKQQSVHDE